jgi:hypothetical protein
VNGRKIDVLDADVRGGNPIASFAGQQLDPFSNRSRMSPGRRHAKDTACSRRHRGLVFMWVSLDRSARIPGDLRHRILSNDNSVEGSAVALRTGLRVLGPPVTGMHWLGADAPAMIRKTNHRRGILVMDGHVAIDRRFATDWKQVENGASFSATSATERVLRLWRAVWRSPTAESWP